jgi:hypothetical protein
VCVIEPEQEFVPEPATAPAPNFAVAEDQDQPAVFSSQMSLEEITVREEVKPEPVAAKPEPVIKPAPKKDSGEKTSSTVRNEIGTNVHDDPFIVYTPQNFCCNCGTEHDVSCIETYFYQNFVFSTRFEKDKAISLTLPYCPLCSDSVGRYPMSAPLKWLVAFCVWFGGLFLMFALFNVNQLNLFLRLLVLIVPIVPAVFAFRFLERARAPQTSAYTPVIIKEFSRNPNAIRDEGRAMILVTAIAAVLEFIFKSLSKYDPDKINKFTIKFSNRAYGKEFKKKNKNFIQEGLIKVL